MRNSVNNQEELQGELETLRARVKELEHAQAEHERMLAALRASEEQWRSLGEHASNYIVTLAPDATILTVSRTPEGITPDEVIGRNAFEFVGPEGHAALRSGLENVFRARASAAFENSSPGPGGSTVWCDTRLGPIIERGEVVSALLIGTDITARKRTEEALKRSEAFLNVTGRMAKVGGWELDAVTREVRWTDETYRIHEVPLDHRPPLDEAIGFYHPEDRPILERAIRRALDHGEPYDLELRFTTAQGRHLWVHTICYPSVEDGKTIKLAGTFQDITERKLAEEALRESETRLRQIANTIEDVFWMTDWSSKRTLFASPAYEKIWGRPLQDLYNNPQDWADAIHPDDRQRAWETFLHLGKARAYDEEYRIVHPDGSVKWIRDRGYPVRDASGRVYQVVGIAQDITARKRAEEEKEKLENQLRHAQKMEAVGQLAGGVAHDFNNVLTVIFGTVELLLPMIERGLDASSTEAAKSGLEEIKFAGQRAAALTRQLLTFGRKGMVKVEVLDLDRVIHDAEKLLRRLLREDIVFDVNVAAGVPHIRADAVQIEQVMMNLVVNARDAMPTGGTLAVTCADVEVDEAHAAAHVGAKPGPYVMLAVSDTGVGMSKETMDHMFEPFFTTKPSGEGAGLGLATVYGIVRQTGAHITVESEVGKGSVFTVYFPAVEEEAGKPETAASDQGFRGDEVILVCEDQELVRRMSCQVLRAAGYTVLEAENGRHALDVAAGYDGRINLLISDVVMPEMNGKELAESMMQRYPGLPILFTSGYTVDVLDGQVSRSDVNDFLQKPFTPTALLQHVRALLDRRSGR